MSDNIPRSKTDVSFLTPADLNEDQKSIIWVMAERVLREVAEKLGKKLSIAESRQIVDHLIERALAYLPEPLMLPVIKGLDQRAKHSMMLHALNHEAVALLNGASATNPRAIRRASAPRGDDVFRLNLTLSHDMDAAINDIGYRSRATGGARLAKTEVIRAACRLLLELDADLTGVKSEDELLERLRAAAGLGGKGKK